MWHGRIWMGLLLAAGVLGATALGRAQSGATEEACEQACKGVIAKCTSVFGPAMGDMRPFCTSSVVRRCVAGGVAVCAAAPEGTPPAAPAPTTP